MNAQRIEAQGVLRPDGTLVLNERPNLPPGPVRVVIESQPAPAPATEGLLDFVQRVQRESIARGHQFLSDEELTAWVDDLRADDDRLEQAYKAAEAERRRG